MAKARPSYKDAGMNPFYMPSHNEIIAKFLFGAAIVSLILAAIIQTFFFESMEGLLYTWPITLVCLCILACSLFYCKVRQGRAKFDKLSEKIQRELIKDSKVDLTVNKKVVSDVINIDKKKESSEPLL